MKLYPQITNTPIFGNRYCQTGTQTIMDDFIFTKLANTIAIYKKLIYKQLDSRVTPAPDYSLSEISKATNTGKVQQ